jgi:GxxExxY protein
MHEGHQEHAPIAESVERVGRAVLDASFRVHSALGPGLLETVYEHCLAEELRQGGLHVDQQVPVPVVYGSVQLQVGYASTCLSREM